mgnify:CR=1 FL=1
MSNEAYFEAAMDNYEEEDDEYESEDDNEDDEEEVEDEEGSAGMRLHRSWWVHARHVRTVGRRGEAAICELSDGREVPISRRRKADAVARFGDRARYQEMPTASKSLPAREGQNNLRNPN